MPTAAAVEAGMERTGAGDGEVIFGPLKPFRRPHKLNGNKCETEAAAERAKHITNVVGAACFSLSIHLTLAHHSQPEARVVMS